MQPRHMSISGSSVKPCPARVSAFGWRGEISCSTIMAKVDAARERSCRDVMEESLCERQGAGAALDDSHLHMEMRVKKASQHDLKHCEVCNESLDAAQHGPRLTATAKARWTTDPWLEHCIDRSPYLNPSYFHCCSLPPRRPTHCIDRPIAPPQQPSQQCRAAS